MDAFKYILAVLLLTLLFYSSVVYSNLKKKSKYQIEYYLFASVLIVFFSIYFAFRLIYSNDLVSYGGVDAIVYKTRFENATGSLIASLKNQQYEFGYGLFVYIIRQITSSYIVFQIIYYLILFIIVFYILKKLMLKRGIISFILIFIYISIPFFDSMNITRNMLAYFLSMLSLVLMIRKKVISSLIIALIATSIHISSIILLVIYALYYITIKIKSKKIKYFYVFSAVILTITFVILISVFRPYIMQTKYSSYFEIDKVKIPYGLIIERITAIFLFVFLRKKRNFNKRFVAITLIVLSLSVVFTILQIILPILYRVNVICGVGCFFTFALLNKGYYSLKRSNYKRYAYTFAILVFFIFKINSTITDTIVSYGLSPHYYVWEEGIIS